jgi:hypothetical protein
METNQITWGFNNRPAAREDVLSCVGKGWHKLVNSLIDDLFKLGWDGSLLQIKEKFGGLRFYIGQGSAEIFDRLYIAEEESIHTCEECGEPGELYYDGWIRCLCPVHAKEQGREKIEFKTLP